MVQILRNDLVKNLPFLALLGVFFYIAVVTLQVIALLVPPVIYLYYLSHFLSERKTIKKGEMIRINTFSLAGIVKIAPVQFQKKPRNHSLLTENEYQKVSQLLREAYTR